MNKIRVFSSYFMATIMLLGSTILAMPANAQDTSTFAAGPTLVKAEAKNSGGTTAFEAGDSVALVFSKPSNKFAVTASNIATEFSLSGGHSFLDGASAIASANWNEDGSKLTIILSAASSLPTVAVGDTVTMLGSDIKDLTGNAFTGSAVISGSFTAAVDQKNCSPAPAVVTTSSDGTEAHVGDANETEDNDCNDEDNDHHICGNTLVNGQLYKIGTEATVYLASDCRLKPFRGEAVFHARGLKFQNVITLATLPAGVIVKTDPVLPADGTLIKGSDKTVWFVGKNGKRRGFTSAQVFSNLGFKFSQVDQISDSDLSTMATDTTISDSTEHPDGALIKCGNSADVFVVIGGMRFPFANAQAFTDRGHSFEHILNVDCGRFAYQQGAPISK